MKLVKAKARPDFAALAQDLAPATFGDLRRELAAAHERLAKLETTVGRLEELLIGAGLIPDRRP